MKRRSKDASKRAKARRPNASKSKHDSASKQTTRTAPSVASEQGEITQLGRELNEAREQQTATAGVLRMISRYPSDVHSILEAIVRIAGKLCEAEYAILFRLHDGKYHVACSNNAAAEFVRYFAKNPIDVNKESLVGRTALARRAVHIEDCLADPEYKLHIPARLGRHRTMLGVPLLHEGVAIGVIGLLRTVVKPFTKAQIELVTSFADQAVIAIENARLLNELRQRTTDLSEALEQQTATSEVLRVISSSPGDLEPVFGAMLENAVRICDAKFGNIYRWDADALHLVASHNTPTAYAEHRRRVPLRLDQMPESLRRMVGTKAPIHVHDIRTLLDGDEQRNPVVVAGTELGGIRTVLNVPMLKESSLVGAFIVSRQEVRPFTDKQIELIKNFAAQAVIAIENARLLNEQREALEHQTATANVLHVINSSPGDLKPVFEAMLESATRICEASFGSMLLREGERLHRVAVHNAPPSFVEFHNRHQIVDYTISKVITRIWTTKQLVHITDLLVEDPNDTLAKFADARTLLVVPLLKDDELVGIFGIYRQEVRPFTDKQIALVTNFASQAVIAIENARLLSELRQRTAELTERTTDLTEALEQQTATSEVLQVVSSSPSDLQPVFAAMLENAVRICGATFGNIFRWDGEAFHLVAAHKTPPAFAKARKLSPLHPVATSHFGRLLETKSVVHTPNLSAEQQYAEERRPAYVEAVELGGIKTFLAVPMLKDDELIGAFGLFRQEVRPFTDKQIELVKNFAAQAVIAIENARLLNELRQSLEQQTATSQVLQVISSSQGDLEPVFQAILENATRICDAKCGFLYRYDGRHFSLATHIGAGTKKVELMKSGPITPDPTTILGRIVASRKIIEIEDATKERGYLERHPVWVASVEDDGARGLLGVPMLKNRAGGKISSEAPRATRRTLVHNALVGAIVIFRPEVRPFTEKQIELVKNFANQAVIAIENARLLNELRQRTTDLTEALEQQTATSEVLQVISSSPGELEPVFATMLEKAARLCDATFGNIYQWDGEFFNLVAAHNTPPAFLEVRRRLRLRFGPKDPVGRMLTNKTVVHIADLAEEQDYIERSNPGMVAAVELGGIRTHVVVPLLKDDELIGTFHLSRQEVRPFTDKQIELVTNFAAQAVLAIENTRLLKELRERTEEVEKLNQHLEQRVSDQVGEIERMSRLRRFLPPQVADLIVASGSEKQLESHRREIAALFCDLRGFTGFTESSDAEDVMALLRDYHAAIGQTIIKYGGTLERFAGDGVMVIFNDPVPVENPALQAVLMALEVRDALGALTATWSRLGHEIGFGIGIAHGFATLGTIGFEGRFDYAAIGTVSNVASRLCDEAKPGQILISPRVLMKVENAVEVEPVGEFELKGIRRPLAAYNVVGAASSEA